jgi:glycosyltransferase involved in cell wall biosynthesis
VDKSAQPLVCISIPTYNSGKTLAATLESVLNQTYRNLVVQVVDNASTDNTVAVARSFSDPRLSVHQNPENVGAEGNFNRCITLSKGKYTAIYHADDLYEPTMVEKQVLFLEVHPEARAVFAEASLIDENGAFIGAIHQPAELAAAGALHDFSSVFKAILKHSNFLICPSVMALTELYRNEIREWRGELFRTSADLDVWLRMLRHGPIGLIPEALMRYRISSSQWSAKVRLDTRRADFFAVVDHYLAMEDVRAQLTTTDLQNYDRLEQRDKAMRAANAFLQDQHETARQLCSEVLSWSSFVDATKSKRGLLVFLLAGYVRLALLTGMQKPAKALLMRLKQAINK